MVSGDPLDSTFDYDVAFSFTLADESLATALNDLLSARMKTFIYSERQRELAGTDGQESFSKVYGESARLVVIFYRPEWGQTRWTGVEEHAIRQRAFEHQFDFTFFIPTVSDPKLPSWLPKMRLYWGLERWGLAGAAAAIEARLTELGGRPREEDVADRAQRFARSRRLEEAQRRFSQSEDGPNAAKTAYDEFSQILHALTQELRITSDVKISYTEDRANRILEGLYPNNAIAHFNLRYSNTLDESKFELAVYRGFPEIGGGFRGSVEKATKLWSCVLSYRLIREGYHCWVSTTESYREFTPDALAQYFLKAYMDASEKSVSGRRY